MTQLYIQNPKSSENDIYGNKAITRMRLEEQACTRWCGKLVGGMASVVAWEIGLGCDHCEPVHALLVRANMQDL